MARSRLANAKKSGGRKKSRLKVPLLCLGGTVLLLGCIFLGGRLLSPESLTDDQVLAKTGWTEQEIVQTAVQRLQAKRRGEGSAEVYKRLQEEIRKLPQERQGAVRDTIMKEAIAAGLREYRLLATGKQQELVKKMTEQFARRRSEIAKGQIKPEGPAAKMAEGGDPDRKQRAAKVMQEVMDQITPDERRDLAPLVKEWVKIAEAL